MDPGGQHARPVQRALDPGGGLLGEPVGEPDQLPERRAGTSRAVGGPQVGGGRGVVVLAGDLVPFPGPRLLLGGELGFGAGELLPAADQRVGPRLGERGERLGERGRVRLAGPAQGAGQRIQAGLVQDRRRLVTGPPGGPAAQLPGHLRAGGGQSLLRVPAGLVAGVEGLPGLAEFGLGELAGLLGLLHGGEPSADLGDVVAPGGDPGLGRHGQVGAGVRGLAVAEQARAGRRLGQRLQVPADGAAQLVPVAGHGVGLLLQAVDVGPGLGQLLLVLAEPGLVRLQLAAAQREFLVILVGVAVLQRREPGAEGVHADPGRLPGFLRPLFLPSGRGRFTGPR